MDAPNNINIPPEWVFFGETVSSRLGLRTEISARYRLQMNRTDGPHLFCFHENVGFCQKSTNFCGKIEPIFCEEFNRFSVGVVMAMAVAMAMAMAIAMAMAMAIAIATPHSYPL